MPIGYDQKVDSLNYELSHKSEKTTESTTLKSSLGISPGAKGLNSFSDLGTKQSRGKISSTTSVLGSPKKAMAPVCINKVACTETKPARSFFISRARKPKV